MSLGAADAAALERCVAGGGVAVFPADTVYGLCCDPDDAAAAERIYEMKGRPPARPAAVMFFTLTGALAELDDLAPHERSAVEALMPGPVTLLLANPARRYAPACGPDPETLGLRVPALGLHAAALQAVARPVLQTSANDSGGADAARLADVPARIRDAADLVLDGGTLGGLPSTVIDLRAGRGRWQILRAGALPERAVEEALGERTIGGR
ncbi:MAG TPA: L-threonylcarbamoyladenylate synthase [Solirubrobacteraceae bacterium]|nr:L-threonylcarbamoyladenylate synthase [Solirubrobacteraceae bacterium]